MARLDEGFVHLRTRSAYSLLEGTIKADAIGKLARSAGMPAVALTDRENLCGALEFSVATKDTGVQPIIGCALPVSGIGEGPPERWARIPTIVLLAQNEAGWRNLTELSSAAFLDVAATDEAHVPWAKIAQHAEGLLLLSGGPDGPVDPLFAAGRSADAEKALGEMQPSVRRPLLHRAAAAWPGERGGRRARPRRVRLRARHPAGGDQRRLLREGRDPPRPRSAALHPDGAFLGQDERRRVTAEHWFKGAAEMRRLFADLPEACDNTLDIARRCAFAVAKRDPVLPRFPTAGGRSEAEELTAQAREGLKARLAIASVADEAPYWQRLETEIGVIQSMGFSGYFLIVSDFMKWAVACPGLNQRRNRDGTSF